MHIWGVSATLCLLHCELCILHFAFHTVHCRITVCGPIAQSVEQVAFNHWVAGSSPARITIFNDATEGKTSKVAAVELPPDQPPIALASRSDVTSDGTFLGTIPSFGGTVTSFRFFTTNEDIPPPQGMREYQTRFSKATLGTVYYEFSVKYVTENAANFTMASTWSRGAGPLVRQELPVAKPANWNTSTRSYGYGSKEPGKWEPGTYTVKVEVEGRKVAEGSFVVY